jgi:hypothetical protein
VAGAIQGAKVATVACLKEVASQQNKVNLLPDGLLDEVQKDPAEVVKALFGAILLVAVGKVGNVHEPHKATPFLWNHRAPAYTWAVRSQQSNAVFRKASAKAKRSFSSLQN